MQTLKFDINTLYDRARAFVSKRVSGVTLKLPFVSFNVKPKDLEKKVAREIVIRLADRRVLSSRECCDDCVTRSLCRCERSAACSSRNRSSLPTSQTAPSIC